MVDLTLVTYTNSKASDLHRPYFDRIRKYLGEIKHLIISDEPVNDYQTYVYKENDPHYLTMINSLSMVDAEFIIYSQEDYILFDFVKKEKIEEFTRILKEDPKISFIRLIYSGIRNEGPSYNEDLFYLDSYDPYYYSTQITIWRTRDLKEMFAESRVMTLREEPNNSIFLRIMNKTGLCCKEKGSPIGSHFNSSIYPYVATAIVRGKWNYSEYSRELNEIFNEYGIPKNERGVC